jgi:CRP/FNR family cyclic AMP-dependent transcriptional regulator
VTHLIALSADLPLETVPSGEVVIAEGSPPDRMLILVSGAVVIERDGVAFARIDAPGSVFGEMSVVLDRPASATVRAAQDVELRVVADPMTFFAERPGAAVAVLRMTAARLDGLTRYLVDVKQQFADAEGHLGLVDQILDRLVHHQGLTPRTGSARDPEGTHAQPHG